MICYISDEVGFHNVYTVRRGSCSGYSSISHSLLSKIDLTISKCDGKTGLKGWEGSLAPKQIVLKFKDEGSFLYCSVCMLMVTREHVFIEVGLN